ncbi:MAG: substrate-binding domain-containing protein [Bacillota bacterium]|nr:substrate-binding domain-containing protein [Bacillota bacterium]
MPLVGVIVHDITDPYFSEIVRGVEDLASENDHLVLVCNTDRSARQEIGYIQTLRETRVSGIILAGGGLRAEQHQQMLARQFEGLRRERVAVVALATQHVCFPTIHTDNIFLGKTITSHLIELGHRRIAFVAGPQEIFTSHERLEGYHQALSEASIAHDPSLVVWSNFTEKGGIESVRLLYGRAVQFTAIAASNDETAIGCLWELRRRGVRVPEDVSVIGANNLPSSEYVDPPLTTMDVPMYEMGRRAMEVILHVCGGGDYPDIDEKVPLRLVVRGSTRAIEGSN